MTKYENASLCEQKTRIVKTTEPIRKWNGMTGMSSVLEY
jgi:hypothetical protein